MRTIVFVILSLLATSILASENPVLTFQKEKDELTKLIAACELTSSSPIASAETTSGNSYLLVLGQAQCADGNVGSTNPAKTIAHAKALRTISQFMKTEVDSEESLKVITTVKSANGSDKTKSTERVRTETIRIRSMAIISQAYIVESKYDASTSTYNVSLALRLSTK